MELNEGNAIILPNENELRIIKQDIVRDIKEEHPDVKLNEDDLPDSPIRDSTPLGGFYYRLSLVIFQNFKESGEMLF